MRRTRPDCNAHGHGHRERQDSHGGERAAGMAAGYHGEPRRPAQRGVVLEDPLLEAAQVRPPFHGEFLDKAAADGLVRGEGVGLPTGSVEGEHQRCGQALSLRMFGGELFKLGNQLRAPAHAQFGVDPVFQRGQPFLFEPPDLALREWLVGQVGQGRASPQRERGGQLPRNACGVTGIGGLAGVRGPAPELFDVELARCDTQDVPARPPR